MNFKLFFNNFDIFISQFSYLKKFSLCVLLLILYSQQTVAQELKEVLINAYTSRDSSDYYFKIAKSKIKNKEDETLYFFAKMLVLQI
jgi:hypothetical protein